MAHLTYLAVLGGCLLAIIGLEAALRIRLYARWRRLMLALAAPFALFTGWDVYAIGARQWSYERRWTTGVLLGGRLPIEEVAFFVVIPVCAVATLEAVRRCRPRWRIGDEISGPSEIDGATRSDGSVQL